MPEIHLALIEYATLIQEIEKGRPRRKALLRVPENPITLDYERKQSPYFWLEHVNKLQQTGSTAMASHENPLVTPSAGTVSVFYDDKGPRYVSFSQKDAGAPRDPGFRVPRNGFPRSPEDWFTNNHLYQETFEEGIFVTRSGELVLTGDAWLDSIVNRVAENVVRQTGLKIKGTRRERIYITGGPDTLEVYRKDEERPALTDSGVISWTPETGFNFIKFMEVHYPIEDLWLVDGETFPNGNVIGRDVCVIDLQELRGKRFGDPIHETMHRMKSPDGWYDEPQVFERNDKALFDKVPRSVLSALRPESFGGDAVYPIDWMDESYDFLLNPRTLAEFSRFGWSALERKIKKV